MSGRDGVEPPAGAAAGRSGDGLLGGRPLPPGEATRKGVHAGMAVFALALAFLSWPVAAACAMAAFLFNWLLLPLVVGHRLASARAGASDRGVLLYPLVVLALIGVFRERLEMVAFAWGVLALGDAAAGVVGLRWGRARLPWNPGKSWEGVAAGVLAGWVGGGLLWVFVASGGVQRAGLLPDELTWPGLAGVFLVAAAIAALVESAPLAVDDNVIAPLAGVLALAALLGPPGQAGAPLPDWPYRTTDQAGWLLALAVNGACAALAAWKRVLSPAGIAGALVLGLVTWGFGGVALWLVLLAFLVGGTAATRVGWRRKTELGIAEGDAGRRGLGNVAAKGAVVFVTALLTPFADPVLCAVMAVAALAGALADTAGSELGKALGRHAFSLPGLRRVAPGTAGAVSVPGSVAMLAGGAGIGALAWSLGVLGLDLAALGAGVGVAAALAESGFDRRVGHDAVNFTLTVVAATAAGALAVAGRWAP